jgi:hypothetical protein
LKKKILYLTFFYEPDLSAGSFRNTALAQALRNACGSQAEIFLYTSQPNRYHTYKIKAPSEETTGNLHITRISIPSHKNSFFGQMKSYRVYYSKVMRLTRQQKYDLVFVSSGRFFTSYLGYKIAKRNNTPLYLDIRDIFSDTLKHVLHKKWYKKPLIIFLEMLEKKPFKYATHVNLVSEGFKQYFTKYKGSYTYFTNGIDEEFLEHVNMPVQANTHIFTILYAGNIGEGQGLEKIIPEAAQKSEGKYFFRIVGDGGARHALERKINAMQLKNVEILDPVSRDTLRKMYAEADFLFLHLNNYEAFKKVLPSKLFEYAAYPKPLIAGVAGYAAEFIAKYVTNTILFEPGDAQGMISKLEKYHYQNMQRNAFIQKFSRKRIASAMAENILHYLS